MKRILFADVARRALRALPVNIVAQIESKLARYAATGAGDVTKLVGSNRRRLRIGDYRVVFTEDDATILINLIGHRKDIYR